MVYMDSEKSVEGDELIDLESGRRRSGDWTGEEREKRAKKGSKKKPPKPPRPPKSPSLDAADQKLMKEISEMAVLKRARMDRMRALKKMKNAKTAAAPSSNLCALMTTVVFCILIIWQGFFSRGSSTATFQGSPESSIGPGGGLISVQFYRNNSTESPHGSNSVSPNNVEQISGLDDHGEGSRTYSL